jgi:hypothetical protein
MLNPVSASAWQVPFFRLRYGSERGGGLYVWTIEPDQGAGMTEQKTAAQLMEDRDIAWQVMDDFFEANYPFNEETYEEYVRLSRAAVLAVELFMTGARLVRRFWSGECCGQSRAPW